MESIYALWTVAAIAAVGIMSPGPDFLAVSYAAITGMRRDAAAVAAGVVLGNGLWAGAALLGVGALFTLFPSLFLVIKLCGAAYIAWLGIQLLRSARTPLPERTAADPSMSLGTSFAKGLSTTMANPKAALYYASALSSAAPENASMLLLGWMLTVVVAVAVIWFSVVVLVLSTPRASSAFRRFKVYFESLFCVLLLAFGLKQFLSRA
jgi:threonine/homoserine/homoserine lactone efflux protein